MECKLCLQNKKLIQKSHIIPKFMHKGLIGIDNEFYRINIKNFSQSQKIYTGEFEPNILCEECDNAKLSNLETYAHRILYVEKFNENKKFNFKKYKNQHGVISTYIKGIDYKKFKLFLLSILWCSSISNREFFSKVKLGPHEEIIRKMLLNEQPDSYKKYPCFISTYLNSRKELPPELIGQPVRVKNNDGTRYVFLIDGFFYIYFVSQHAIPDWIYELCINEKNELIVPHMSKEKGKEMLNYFLGIKMFK